MFHFRPMDDYGGIDEAFELFFKLLRINRVYGRVILSAGRPRKKEKPDEIKSVVLTFTIIEFLAKCDRPLGVTEIATALDLEKPRVYRHLRTLSDIGYIDQDSSTDKYCLSMKFFWLGKDVESKIDLISVSRPAMQQLKDTLGTAVTLSTISEDNICVLDILRGSSQIDISTRPGSTFPLHATAQGKIALAFGHSSLRDKISNKALEKFTTYTIISDGILAKEIEKVRSQNWAIAPEEITLGINALAAPILDHHNQLVGTIGILSSIHELTSKPTIKQIEAVKTAALEISIRLGFKRDNA
ncbi:MAG: IclR family transcriptional regulator [Kordiimonadaceae bacterium]|nr:IclR family transcriptional regulator [Kordiimonadaceae bacterium]